MLFLPADIAQVRPVLAFEEPSHIAVEHYSAVAFDYGASEPTAAASVVPTSAEAISAVPAIPDIPFVPGFAIPASVRGHAPATERMHKVLDAV